MLAIKKLRTEEFHTDYSPRILPEIIKLAKEVNEKEAVIYTKGRTNPYLFETNRLIIRHFFPEDTEAIQSLAINRQNSEMKNYDHQWPTDYEGCKGVAEWFSIQENMWAVCLKPELNIIGMISFNTVDELNQLDLGHVWHTNYQKDKLDSEALSLMTQYAFEKLNVDAVYANNPLECETQLAPLKDMGAEITETSRGFFVKDEQDNPIYFTGCKMVITKDKWDKK